MLPVMVGSVGRDEEATKLRSIVHADGVHTWYYYYSVTSNFILTPSLFILNFQFCRERDPTHRPLH